MQPQLIFVDKEEAEKQLLAEQKSVRYDTKEFTVEIMVEKLRKKDLEIPEYQRKFVWDEFRKCKFIESVLLGIPIPFMFGFDLEQTGKIEIIDGAQRIKTLEEFIDSKMVLDELEKLNLLNGYKFDDLSPSQQRRFKNRTIRMIVLYEETDFSTRFEIFERINSTPMHLRPGEIRKGAFRGLFYDLIEKCGKNPLFRELCPLSEAQIDRAEAEEMVLRFFAYADTYSSFVHDVRRFLDTYLVHMNKKVVKEPDIISKYEARFDAMLSFIKNYFPYGFKKGESGKSTPRVRFEAISVGVDLALRSKPNLIPNGVDWLSSKEFETQTRTHASNSGPRLAGRVEFVRDRLLKDAS